VVLCSKNARGVKKAAPSQNMQKQQQAGSALPCSQTTRAVVVQLISMVQVGPEEHPHMKLGSFPHDQGVGQVLGRHGLPRIWGTPKHQMLNRMRMAASRSDHLGREWPLVCTIGPGKPPHAREATRMQGSIRSTTRAVFGRGGWLKKVMVRWACTGGEAPQFCQNPSLYSPWRCSEP
jgi:hypothetical protein